MATQNTNTGFSPDYIDRWAAHSVELQQRRKASYDANMKIVNDEFRRLVAQRKGV